MNLDIEHWKEFKICNLFDVFTGGDLILAKLEVGEIPVASNSCQNNNIAAYTSEIEDRKLFDHTKSISIADRGKFWAFIQPKDFYIGTRVKALVCKTHLNLSYMQMCFIVSIINQESFKFSYGRNCCEKLPNIIIKLPVKHIDGVPKIDKSYTYSEKGYIPDFEWMESYIKTLHHKPITTKNISQPAIDVSNWKKFSIKNLFSMIEKGKCKNAKSLDEGSVINYIGAKRNDNGVIKKCDDYLNLTSAGNCIAMIGHGEGSAGYAIYMDKAFIGSSSLNIGYASWINQYTGTFVATILCQENDKYSHGRSWTGDRLLNTEILLPAKENGTPDFEWMENYIKSLPYGDRLLN